MLLIERERDRRKRRDGGGRRFASFEPRHGVRAEQGGLRKVITGCSASPTEVPNRREQGIWYCLGRIVRKLLNAGGRR
jgi:hypothetical protein